MDGVGVVAVGAGGDHVGGRAHDTCEALLDVEGVFAPACHALCKHPHLVVAHVDQGGASEEGVAAVGADHADGGVLGGDELLDLEFKPAAGYPEGAGDVGAGEVLGCADVDDCG